MRHATGLFIAEGASDEPLAAIVQSCFFARGVNLRLSSPDLTLLPGVGKRLQTRITAGIALLGAAPDVVVMHRDANGQGRAARLREMHAALADVTGPPLLVPVIPVRMTEAWLLIDELSIRQVAGNPGGVAALDLPSLSEVERRADPKAILRTALLAAGSTRGRRRQQQIRRFDAHRRQLFERLDPGGPITQLASWRQLQSDIDAVTAEL